MINWAVPWTTNEIIDFLFLVVTSIIVGAVPLVYVFRANLRDPLARAVLAGTGATALAFHTTLVFTLAVHLGWHPPEQTQHWLARGIYTAVGVGKFLLLTALLSVLRTDKKIAEAVAAGNVEAEDSR